jgi:hypothetical protein
VSSKAEHIATVAKGVGDAAAVSVTLATMLEWLPALAALFTIIWTAIRIYETRTVQGWLKRRSRT